jgi:antirestriction protein ArdC
MKNDEQKDLYLRITNTIVAELEKGVRPWVPNWISPTMPCRPLRANEEAYRGINVLLLWLAASKNGYRSPYWFTYRQAAELGGFVRKGEKATPIVYAGSLEKTERDEKGEEQQKTIPFLRMYSVFNLEQTEQLPEKYRPIVSQAVSSSENEPIEAIERFFRNTGAHIVHGDDSPHYSILYDRVHMPPLNAFKRADDYYSTLAHEVTHWTGHPGRTPRNFREKTWSSTNYAREELVAELGAAFLCADLEMSLEPRADHAEYIGSWLQVLRSDKRAIFHAAAMAQKAVDFLHALQKTQPASSRESQRKTA